MRKLIILIASCVLLLTLAGCGETVDKQYAEPVIGEYQAVETEETDNPDNFVGGWWHLQIGYGDDGELYLSIYDNSAGNPGIEGKVKALDAKAVKIEYDPDLYDQLPCGRWKTKGKYLEMTYNVSGTEIKLTNSGYTVRFERESNDVTLCAHWRSEDEEQLESIDFADGSVTLKGQYYDTRGIWADMEESFKLAEDCGFTDEYLTGKSNLTQEDFEELLQQEGTGNSAIKLTIENDEVTEIKLVYAESCDFGA